MRKFGIEIEAKGMSPTQAHDAIRSAGVAVENHGHTHTGPRCAGWKVVYDGSVAGGFEAVSHPMQDDSTVGPVCDALQQAGAWVDRKCGLHVHVDARDLDVAAWRRLIKLWARIERALDSVLAPSRREMNQYCNNLLDSRRTVAVIDRAVEAAPTVERAVNDTFGSSRYFKMNCQAWWKHGTVEFRGHHGSLNPIKIRNWVRLCVAVVEAARNGAVLPVAACASLEAALDLVLSPRFETTTVATVTTSRVARPGSKTAALFAAFAAAPAGTPASAFRHLEMTLGVLPHVVRARHSEWTRAQVPAAVQVAAPTTAPVASPEAAQLKRFFLARAAELAGRAA